MSFDTAGCTMMGVTGADFIGFGAQLPQRLAACVSNCGVGAAEVVAGMLAMKRAAGDAEVVLVAKGNCGVPKFVDGAIRYDGMPELMVVYARMALDAGARIVGGCCGTTPAHLRAMRTALEAHTRAAPPTLDEIEARLGAVSRGARAQVEGGTSVGPRRVRAGRR